MRSKSQRRISRVTQVLGGGAGVSSLQEVSRGQASQKELYFSFLWFDSSGRYSLDTWLGKDSSSSENIDHIM